MNHLPASHPQAAPLLPPLPPDGPHHAHWPAGVPRRLAVPDESLWWGLARRAAQQPEAVGLTFMDRRWTWGQLQAEAERLAAGLQGLGVGRGDRVLVFMQNCPQFILSFFAVLRLDAVVVPVNPMNKADELGHYIHDAAAKVAIASADIAGEMARASDGLVASGQAGQVGLTHLVVFHLSEGLPEGLQTPGVGWPAHWPTAWQPWLQFRHPQPALAGGEVHTWAGLLAAAPARPTGTPQARAADLAILPYTSGTTGAAKGCMHGHGSLLHNALSGGPWLDMRPGDTTLVVVPMFHITGLVMALLATVQTGGAIVLMPRWDRDLAARLISAERVTHWPNIPTMVIDLLGSPRLAEFDLSCLRYVGGGGTTMPEAIATRLREQFGLEYLEGYGLTETSAPTHCNPRGGARRQCLGIPYLSTQAQVVDPDTLEPVATGEVGEIVVSGPQVFQGYWGNPQATASAFFEREGQRWFRTGDLGRVDDTGYYTLADRLKRMINASGFKVWPAEVEALMHHHPGVQEVCIIATRDPYRGESVKAVIVPKDSARATLTQADVIAWCKAHMSAYKVPRTVQFTEALPKSASGKLLWRVLQQQEDGAQVG
ncbi:long-chain-fatty-acid--CoA ligase [Ideonella livida]|uniref:AMP-binding protein n=1 Tax=Ideonella livida TaxID=2707176 RepID=A0A7C9PIW3_9BURK|nr:long-chain-fatty-acid--CoA ligase [Ideonella livida]NDY93137.1 AMP-binding protein [Ideonella livida]